MLRDDNHQRVTKMVGMLQHPQNVVREEKTVVIVVFVFGDVETSVPGLQWRLIESWHCINDPP